MEKRILRFLMAIIVFATSNITFATPFEQRGIASQEQGEPPRINHPAAELALMKTVLARVEFYQMANNRELKQMTECLRGVYKTPECDERIAIAKNFIEVKYPIMRRYQLLMNMLQIPFLELVDNVLIFDTYNLNEGKPLSNGMSKSVVSKRNPLDGMLEDVMGFFEKLKNNEDLEIPNPDYTDAEMLAAVSGQSTQFITHDEETGAPRPMGYPENLNGALQMICETGIEAQYKSYCKQIKAYYDVSKHSIRFRSTFQGPVYKKVISAYRIARPNAFSLISKLYKGIELKFYDLVQETPYIALTTRPFPDQAELQHIFNLMYQASGRALTHFKEEWDEKKSDGVLTRKELLQVMDYSAVVSHAVDGYYKDLNELNGAFRADSDDVSSEEKFRPRSGSMEMELYSDVDYYQLAGQLTSERSRDALIEGGIHIAEMITANVVACWIPVSRPVRALVAVNRMRRAFRIMKGIKTLFSPLCYAITNVGISGYFVNNSINHYKQTYDELFSVPLEFATEEQRTDNGLDSGERYFREMRAMSFAETLLWIDLLTAPIGTGALVNAIAKVPVKLSQVARSYATRVLERRAAAKEAARVAQVEAARTARDEAQKKAQEAAAAKAAEAAAQGAKNAG